ncbi:MAG TPA: LysR family transcriptional regulator [Stellaceae bacterium]|nr:LysR family transcriptional regulator [Stellaceae bacterium]
MAELDLNLLTALEALLAEGSVVGAARRLRLSDSAMSRTLARLREATGDPLLVRAGRRLVPTPRAEELRAKIGGLAEEVRAVLRPADAALDLATLERDFTIRAAESFVEALAARLVTAVAVAPKVRLRFAPKPDKDVAPLREGLIDLEIGVLGESGPEVRVQALFRDHFVGVARDGHPLLAGAITPERFATAGHVIASRRGTARSPVDDALAALALARTVVASVPSFPAALAIVAASDLVSVVPASYLDAIASRPAPLRAGVAGFPLPVATDPITISQMWHPRMDADAAHRWLRGVVLAVCGEGKERSHAR